MRVLTSGGLLHSEDFDSNMLAPTFWMPEGATVVETVDLKLEAFYGQTCAMYPLERWISRMTAGLAYRFRSRGSQSPQKPPYCKPKHTTVIADAEPVVAQS